MTGLTQAEVANRAGVSQQVVANYERGGRQPSVPTLTRLIAGCGLHLSWQLTPHAGLEDWPTRELLAKPPFQRVDREQAATLEQIAAAARGSERVAELVVGSKTAARLHGAVVRAPDIDLWVAEDVDVELLNGFLTTCGIEYVSPSGHSEPPSVSREQLRYGWPLVAPEADLRVASVCGFRGVMSRAMRLHTPESGHPLLVASTLDCSASWGARDRDHLALQRAVRLSHAA